VTDTNHPALAADDEVTPALTLVLPGDAGQVLKGLAEAVLQTRTDLSRWAAFCRRTREECAAVGDQAGYAVARGQIIAAAYAIAHLDENIIAAFGLWDQEDVRLPVPAAAIPGDPAAPDGTGPAGAASGAGDGRDE
jgi:hypothetical protein